MLKACSAFLLTLMPALAMDDLTDLPSNPQRHAQFMLRQVIDYGAPLPGKRMTIVLPKNGKEWKCSLRFGSDTLTALQILAYNEIDKEIKESTIVIKGNLARKNKFFHKISFKDKVNDVPLKLKFSYRLKIDK